LSYDLYCSKSSHTNNYSRFKQKLDHSEHLRPSSKSFNSSKPSKPLPRSSHKTTYHIMQIFQRVKAASSRVPFTNLASRPVIGVRSHFVRDVVPKGIFRTPSMVQRLPQRPRPQLSGARLTDRNSRSQISNFAFSHNNLIRTSHHSTKTLSKAL
jgi:hypothetical protein